MTLIREELVEDTVFSIFQKEGGDLYITFANDYCDGAVSIEQGSEIYGPVRDGDMLLLYRYIFENEDGAIDREDG